jgi:WD40 repeat protein
LSGHTGAINAMALSHDGRHVITGSSDSTARLWDVRERRLLRTFKGHADRIWSVSLSADESRVATASSDHSIKLWNVETSDELMSFSGTNLPRRVVAFSPDGLSLAAGSVGQVTIWNAAQVVRSHGGRR